jgi:glycosyltransferase involved in cell wall biosynthesis
MYRDLRLTMVIPAYNEEKLIGKTIATLPKFVDYAVVVNDGSQDRTLEKLHELRRKDARVIVVDNGANQGVGATVVNGFRRALETDTDLIGVMAADAQCDPDYISKMVDRLIEEQADYVKANRFVHKEALAKMPTYRRLGNIFITMLTKFATGYYSIFDSQNGYGIFTRRIMETMSLELIGKRYDYENTLLIALSIAGAKVRDEPVPAIYGDEVSSIKFLPTAYRALQANFVGFWRRVYYKYVLFNFHPIALFLFSGLFLTLFGVLFGAAITYRRVFEDLSPSTGTVMIVVVPLILGIQLLLTAVTMDMNNEGGK